VAPKVPRKKGRGSGYESLVTKLLELKGYQRIRRNVVKSYGEIDTTAWRNRRNTCLKLSIGHRSP